MSAGVVLLSTYCSKSTLVLSYFSFISFIFFFKKLKKRKGSAGSQDAGTGPQADSPQGMGRGQAWLWADLIFFNFFNFLNF